MDSYSNTSIQSTAILDFTDREISKFIMRIRCPRRCGWYRDYTKKPEWLTEIVDHPLYGPVREAVLVQKDIIDHDCNETYNARLRLKKAQKERNNV